MIDPVSGTLYVEAMTKEVTGQATNFVHRLHALDVATGDERTNSPTVIESTNYPGTGMAGYQDNDGSGHVRWNPLREKNWPALLLANGVVYVAFSSYADLAPFHGWVFAFDAHTMQQVGVFNATPNGGLGGIWMSGAGPAADDVGNIYLSTGNGDFNTNYLSSSNFNVGQSVLKLIATNGLTLGDYFSPFNEAALSGNDDDIASAGVMLLPDSAGSSANPHLMVTCGKEGKIYLLNRDSLGHFNAANDNQIVQELPDANPGTWASPAYFNNMIYYQAGCLDGAPDVLKAYAVTNGYIVPNPVSESTTAFGYPGATPVISANGTNDAIAWVLQDDAIASGPSVLHAYNATNLAQELYNTTQAGSRDTLGAPVRLTVPTVFNGKVYVGAAYGLYVLGNSSFLAMPDISPPGGFFTNAITVNLTETTPGTAIYYTLDGTVPTTNAFLYGGPFLLTNTTLVEAVAASPGAVNSTVATASFVNTSAVGDGSGLLGEYFTNAFPENPFVGEPSFVRTDALVNFNWSGSSPGAGISSSNYTVLWTGMAQPQYSQTYTFYVTADDGVSLSVNGQTLIYQWQDGPPTTWSGAISLQAQHYYNIALGHYQHTNNAEVVLSWSSLSTPMEVVPETQLYPETNPPPAVVLTAPTNNSSFMASASVTVSADAADQYNAIASVSFYANGAALGVVSNAPYVLTATGVQAGSYEITAVALDTTGIASTSAPVNITVNPATGLPYGLTNLTSAPAFYNMPTVYTGTLPALLSQTGVFTNTPAMTPVASLIPYAPNVQLFSDNAQKIRYFSVPNTGAPLTPSEQITYAPTNNWSFPAGTVFVKTFELQTNTSDPTSLLRLETRLLVRDTNGAVYGVTYKWRSDYSDADLLSSSQTEAIPIQTPGGIYTNLWYYPSPSDCLQCHTAVANYVLGANARQFNRTLTYSNGVTDNELRALNRAGLFNPAIDEATITNIEALSALTNLSASYQQRARSYLDANCAQCHQPGGTGPTFDARYDTLLAQQNIIGVPAVKGNLGYDNVDIVTPDDVWRSSLYDRMNVVNPLIQMPPLARNLIDTNAVEVMADWINSLPGTPALPPPTLNPNGGTFQGSVSVSLEDASNNAAIYYTLDGSLPTTSSTLYTGPFVITNTVTLNANAWESGYSNSVVGTALFVIQPNAYFTGAAGFSNGIFAMQISGLLSQSYVIQSSTDLLNWIPLLTNVVVTNPFSVVDSAATNYRNQFYRAVQKP